MLKLNNGQEIPEIGFGTWQLHGVETRQSVQSALAAGYRLIDTARIYRNERSVGTAIKQSDISRSEIFLTTKLWNFSQGYKRAKRAFNASLKRLELEYVDLYLIHWPVSSKRIESWRALEEIYHNGRAKSVGVSNFTIRHLEELRAHSQLIPAVNQIEFHPFLYKEQIEILNYCREHGIVVEAYSPLAHGHRLDDPAIAKIASDHGKSSPQIILRWAVQHGTIPIPKSTNPKRIAENIDIFDFELSAKEMELINNLSEGLRTCWNPADMP